MLRFLLKCSFESQPCALCFWPTCAVHVVQGAIPREWPLWSVLEQQFWQHCGATCKCRQGPVLDQLGLQAAKGPQCGLFIVLVSKEELHFIDELQGSLHISFRQKRRPVVPEKKNGTLLVLHWGLLSY